MGIPSFTTYPVLPIRGSVVFPGVNMPLRVGRLRSLAALKATKDRPWAVLLTQRENIATDPKEEDLYKIGTLVKIDSVHEEEHGTQIFVRGIARFFVSKLRSDGGYLEAEGEVRKDIIDVDEKTHAVLLDSLKKASQEILNLVPADTSKFIEVMDKIDDLVLLANLCSANLDLETPTKQELLEMPSIKDRVLRLLDLMVKLKEGLEVQSTVREKLSHKLGKTQREHILREQLRTIRAELGEGEEGLGGEDYRSKIDAAQMPEDVQKIALEELQRLEAIGRSSPESHVIRNYLDMLCALPWTKSAESKIDLEVARSTLEHDHYGLEKIKKRVLQHLAVMKLRPEGKGTILLFVGPPGVGKTSLGQSIAKALGRKFVRASLGGVRDDAEIRGHRRTYIGAMPGRIIQSIKRAGENNPVIMLDEIDKLGVGFQGDPAAALLEVLDPEQNGTFQDHYLDVPFDLSKVVFIGTANTLETIPGPLRDRMEVIELTGYTTAEKLHIASSHLVPKQLSEHGLTKDQVQITETALSNTITDHTREAGVRELQRRIAEICRFNAAKVFSPEAKLPIVVDSSDLEEILGPARFEREVAEKITPPGVVTGLAWTPTGGDILFVEAELMPGHGTLMITGQLGDVMKESAQIALSLVRSRLESIVPDLDFSKKDIHVHVPAGAIPKDGPSAGIAMLTAVASLFSGKRVDPKMAMTGEVTLRGAVMPVGGIKEKVVAAHRAGIKKILLPKRNEKDLKDVPQEVSAELQFIFVETAAEVLDKAIGLKLLGQKKSDTKEDTSRLVSA